jgi:cytochrome o ubiquinol oxidase subunit III
MSRSTSLSVPHHESHSVFGFWVYILTDCMLFATLFATYAVLQANTFGGPSAQELFSLPFVLAETLILLTSSFTCGLAILAAQKNKQALTVAWLLVTLFLGIVFLVLEISEFRHLMAEGNSWQRSGFLTAFFTLVGTHGAHVALGSIWMLLSIVQILRLGFTEMNVRQLALLSLFWHFLDIVWIFIFTIVYLMGAF